MQCYIKYMYLVFASQKQTAESELYVHNRYVYFVFQDGMEETHCNQTE
jgi:hypothetical protein